jgi:hypothetical protein
MGVTNFGSKIHHFLNAPLEMAEFDDQINFATSLFLKEINIY